MLIAFYTKTPDGQAGQSDQAKRWFDEFELTGPQNVRARFAQTNAGSGRSDRRSTDGDWLRSRMARPGTIAGKPKAMSIAMKDRFSGRA
jgi:hypothetical protein